MDLRVTTPKKSSSLWIEIERRQKQVTEKKKDEDVTEDCSAILLLTRFAERPVISFGKVPINTPKEASLIVKNPEENDQIVTVEKVPEKKGFTVDLEFFEVKKLSEQPVKIVWTPIEAGNYRELITFRLDAIFCKQVILLGSAVGPSKRILKPQNRAVTELRPPISKKKSISLKKTKPPLRKKPKSNENKLQMTFIQRKSIPGGLKTLAELDSDDQSSDISIRAQTKLANSPKATVYLRLTPDLQLRSSSSQPENLYHPCDDDSPLNRRQTFITQPQRPRQSLTTPLSPNQRAPDKFDLNQDRRPTKPTTKNPKSPDFIDRRQTYTKTDVQLSNVSPNSNKKSKIPEPIFKLKSRSRRRSDLSDCNDSLDGDRINDFSSCTTDDDTKPSSGSSSMEIKGLDPPLFFGSEQTLHLTELDYHDFCGNLNASTSDWMQMCKNKLDEECFDEDEDEDEDDLECPFKIKKCSTEVKSIARICNVKAVDSRRELFTDPESAKTSSETFVLTNSSTSSGKWVPELLQTRKSRKKSGIPSLQKKSSEDEGKEKSLIKVKRNSSKTSDSGSSRERGQNKKKKTSRSCNDVLQIDSGIAYKPKLTLIKPPSLHNALTPCHPNPYAAKNIYYDEQWIEKQTQGFTRWLNFILTIPEELGEGEKHKIILKAPLELNRDVTFKQAPSREELSVRTYTVQKKMNLLRRKACNLYQSETVIKVITRLEHEIENRRIAIRSDKALHADVGIRQKLIDLIMSYNCLWLRIGLETVYGQIINLRSNNDAEGLSQFLLNNLLNSPIIAKEYAHASVPHLFKPGFATSLKKHTLKKFLLLVFFLDQAKENYLIEFNPCLFNVDSKFKSSREILLAFSRDHLSGEGDLTKHLAYFGYKVSYTQTALDEYDFSVSNLAVDLRNGLRIARAAQLLTQNWNLMSKLRIPAVTRMQKIHNVTCVLNVLAENDSPIIDMTAKDIVNGHREKTLSFLWQLMFNFQVKLVLSEDKLKHELEILTQSLRSMDIDVEKYANNQDRHFPDEKIELLLRWCQLVSAHYKLTVDNFTVSFSDGRVICYLINYYHPNLLPVNEIKTETTQSYIVSSESISSDDSFNANWTASLCNEKHEQLLKNEQDNFKLALSKVLLCGGIPMMIKPNFMSNTIPDEKVTMVFASYLCARFVDLSAEIRAAKVIQKAWKIYHTKCLLHRNLQSKTEAAIKIQQAVRNHFHRPQMKTQIESAVKIQRRFRMYLLRRRFVNIRKDAIKLQSHIRSFIERKKFRRLLRSVVVIQKWTRMFLARKRYNQMIATIREEQTRKENEAATVIQRAVKNFLTKKKIEELKNLDLLLQEAERDAAATSIQSFWRMCSERIKYKRQRSGIIKLQAFIRRYLARKMYLRKRSATIVVQKWYRSCSEMRKIRTNFVECRKAVVKVQTWYRSWRETKRIRQNFLRTKNAAIFVQDWYRRCKKTEAARRDFLQLKRKIVLIQRFWRNVREGGVQRRKFLQLKTAAVLIQRWFRRAKETQRVRMQFLEMRWRAVTIQRWFRRCAESKKMRIRFLELKTSAVTIQTWYRGLRKTRQIREDFLQQKRAAVIVQRWFRWLKETEKIRMKFLELKWTIVTIQRWYRMCKETVEIRNRFLKSREAAVCIQRWYKRSVDARKRRKEFLDLRCKVIVIQRWYRCSKEMKAIRDDFLKVKRAVICIQRWRRQSVRAKAIRLEFVQMKRAADTIKQWFRRCKEVEKHRKRFLELKQTVIYVQRRYRSRKSARETRKEFLKLRNRVVLIQKWYRRLREAKKIRENFLETRKSAVTIQKWYRSTKEMKSQRDAFLRTKSKLVYIQSWYRRCKESHEIRRRFLGLRKSTISIQRWFRSWKMTRKIRVDYLNLIDTVVRIQQGFRNYLLTRELRRKFIELRQSVVYIQRWFRQHEETRRLRTEFLNQKRAAITIQRWYKCSKETRKIREEFRVWKLNVCKIQDWYRRVKETERVRGEFLRMKMASFVIQRWYRKLKRIKDMFEKAVLRIQMWYRGCKEGRRVRVLFIKKKKAVELIQKWYRSVIRAKKEKKMSLAAAVIQKWYRNSLGSRKYREHFLRIKKSVVCIEKWYLGCKEVDNQRRHFLNCKNAVLCIQRFYRLYKEGRRLRKEFLASKNSAVAIQKYIRGWLQRRKFLKTKWAVVVIQNYFRAWKDNEANRKLCAVVCIQRFIRGYFESKKLREEFSRLRSAVVIVQKNYRMVKCLKDFKLLKKTVLKIEAKHLSRVYRRKREAAVRVIQSFTRAYLLVKRDRWAFLQLKWVAVVVQSCFRMQKCRRRFIALKNCVIVVQKNYRMKKCRNAFKALQMAAVVFQKNFRRKLYQREFLEIKKSALVIQRKWRSILERIHFLNVKAASIFLQAIWRGYKQRKEYLMTIEAVICIQKWYRGCLEARNAKCEYMRKKLAAVKIQAWFKGRLQVRKYEKIQRSVLGLQRYFRANKVMMTLCNKLWAIEVLQRHWRAFIAAREMRKRFLVWKYSAIVLQSWFRMVKDKREFEAKKRSAIKIQCFWRMVKARRFVLLQKQSVVVLEDWILGCWETRAVRESYLMLLSCVVKAQALWRGYKTRKRLKIENEAAVVIQNWYFHCQVSRYCRAYFLQLKYYTTRLQAIRRGCVVRRELFYAHEAAIVIQSSFRRWRDQSSFQLIRGCAIVIQRFWRSCRLTQTSREEFLLKKTSCVILQAFIRGSLIRRRYLFYKYSVTAIQSLVRGVLARNKFRRIKSAAIKIQRYWRQHLLTVKEYTQYHVYRGAVIVIQSFVRGYIVRKRVKRGAKRRPTNFPKLSRFYDEMVLFKQWKDYHILRGAAITIQAWVRGWMTRKKLAEIHRENAVIRIQAVVRGVLARQRLEKERCVCWKFRCKDYVNFAYGRRLQMLNAVRVIERCYQCYEVRQVELLPESQLNVNKRVKGFSKWSRRLLVQRRWFLMMRTAAIIVQKAWRKWVVKREVKRFFEATEVGVSLREEVVEKKRDGGKGKRCKRKAVQVFCLMDEKIASRENYLKCFAAAAKLQLSAIRLQHWIRDCHAKKRNKCAIVIQAAWKGYKLRSSEMDRRISDVRSRINEANQSAVLENTLWSRTTSGLDSLFNCRKLSTVWKALNNLHTSTRLSSVCCERLANSGGIVIIYQLIEGCNRSVPHMEVIMECVCILVNLAKHEPSRSQVWQPEGCGLTIVKLMRHYFEKNEKIVLKCCSLMWLISQDKSCVKQFAQDPVMRKAINNLSAAVSRRFPIRGPHYEASPARCLARKKSQFTDVSFKPDWVLGNDVEREFVTYYKAFPLVIELMKSWL